VEEVRLVPRSVAAGGAAGGASLEAVFAALCACAELHPDPAGEGGDGEGEEGEEAAGGGGGYVVYTAAGGAADDGGGGADDGGDEDGDEEWLGGGGGAGGAGGMDEEAVFSPEQMAALARLEGLITEAPADGSGGGDGAVGQFEDA
jgi:hypothetical protein